MQHLQIGISFNGDFFMSYKIDIFSGGFPKHGHLLQQLLWRPLLNNLTGVEDEDFLEPRLAAWRSADFWDSMNQLVDKISRLIKSMIYGPLPDISTTVTKPHL